MIVSIIYDRNRGMNSMMYEVNRSFLRLKSKYDIKIKYKLLL